MSLSHDLPSYGQQLAAAEQFIKEHDDFLVVSHVQPDGDAASSTFAVGLMLQHLGKTFTMINEGKIPDKFNFLSGFDNIIDYSAHPVNKRYSHVISIDCADFSRIGKVKELFADQFIILNIDHHSTNDLFGSANLIRHDAASTSEILYDLAKQCGVPFSLHLAECIYTGLLTDTGGFRYANTSPKVMDIAAEMLKCGVKGYDLSEILLEKITISHIQLLKTSLSSLSFAEEGKISWISVSAGDIARFQASNEDLEGLVNYPRNIEGVEVGILFKQIEDQTVKISLRSAGKVDVAQIAKSFGGGGHVRAAGCTMLGSLDQVVDQVVTEIGKAL